MPTFNARIRHHAARLMAALILCALTSFPAFADGVCDAPFKDGQPVDPVPHDTAEEAYAHCVAQASQQSPSRSTSWEYHEFTECVRLPNGGYQGRAKVWGNWPGGGTPCQTSGQMQPYGNIHNYAQECVPPATWNEATKTCFDPDECQKRNDEEGFKDAPELVRAWSSRCVAGCTFALDTSQPTVQMEGMYSGYFKFTGQQCSAAPMPPIEDGKEKKPQECKPLGGGQTACLKPNGDHCYSASGGRQICWKPGETGEKTDGPNQQNRNAGPQEKPPANLNLPSGDTLTKNGTSTTTTTTVTNGGNTTNITTTTTNYTTTNGTNAGPNNSGESNTGDGSGKDPKGDKGSASGGGDCKSPPITSGDPILGMVATQAWSTRCAVEAGNAAKVTGDIGDCSVPFAVEGTNANAIKLRAMRAQICPDIGQPGDPGEGETEEDTAGVDEVEVDASDLDDSGWGGAATCPGFTSSGGGSLSQGFMTYIASPPASWCGFIETCRLIFISLATITAIFILKGKNS